MRPTALSLNLISLSLSEGGWVGEVCGHMQHTSRSHSWHQPLSLSPITHSYTLPYDEISCCRVSILFFSKHTVSLHSSMRSSANGVDGDRTGTSNGSRSVDKGVDFANYLCTYALLYHQKEMLCDRVRMEAYYNAVFENKHHFHGKTVLDVGTGSGILAIWSGQAGARKVYAVEATKMSEHALSGLTRLVG